MITFYSLIPLKSAQSSKQMIIQGITHGSRTISFMVKILLQLRKSTSSMKPGQLQRAAFHLKRSLPPPHSGQLGMRPSNSPSAHFSASQLLLPVFVWLFANRISLSFSVDIFIYFSTNYLNFCFCSELQPSSTTIFSFFFADFFVEAVFFFFALDLERFGDGDTSFFQDFGLDWLLVVRLPDLAISFLVSSTFSSFSSCSFSFYFCFLLDFLALRLFFVFNSLYSSYLRCSMTSCWSFLPSSSKLQSWPGMSMPRKSGLSLKQER